MADVNIVGKISVDAGQSVKSIADLKKEINDAKKALDSAAIGSKEYKDAQDKLKKSTTELSESTGQQTGQFGKLKESLGGVIPGFNGASEGAEGFGEKLLALAANPIVLILTGIVAILKFLYDAFMHTSAGADKVGQVMEGISQVLNVLKDRAFALGNAMIKLFSGDFKGAAEDAKKAISGVGDELQNTYNRSVNLRSQLQKIRDDERADLLDKSKRETRLALLREQLNDESLSVQAKIKIAKELRDDQDKNAVEDLARQKKKSELEIDLIRRGRAENLLSVEEKDQINEKLIEINKTQTENALEAVRTNRAIRSLYAQQKSADAAEKAKDKAEKAKEKAAEKEKRKALMDYNLSITKQQHELELLSIKDANTKELRQLDIKLADEKRANKAAFEDKKITKAQELELNKNSDKLYLAQKQLLNDKFNEEKKKKEKDFQTELNKVILETQLAGIEDVREREKKQLEIAYAEKQKQAEEKYKDNAIALSLMATAISIQRKQAERQLQDKFDKEDQKTSEALSLRKIAFQQSIAKTDFRRQKDLLKEKQALINQQYKDEIAAANGNAAKLADIEQRKTESNHAFSEANKAIAKSEMDAKIQALDAVSSTLENASNLFGKATLAGKVLSIASATISTFTSAQKAYEATIGIPVVGPVLAPVNAGLALAAGFKNIKSIASVQVPGGGGSAPSMPTVSAPLAPKNPTPQSTTLDDKSINGIGQASQGGTSRTFVLDSDIKSSQERQARIQRAARLV